MEAPSDTSLHASFTFIPFLTFCLTNDNNSSRSSSFSLAPSTTITISPFNSSILISFDKSSLIYSSCILLNSLAIHAFRLPKTSYKILIVLLIRCGAS